MQLNFATESYSLQARPASSELLVNAYVEKLPDGAPWPAIVRSTPGLSPAFKLGVGPIWTMNDSLSGRLYVVSGTHFFRLRPDAEMPPEDLADIGPVQSGFYSIAVGTTSACVCVPPHAWVCDHSGPLTQIDDPAFTQYGASSVSYIDGYFVFTAFESSSRWFCSDLLSGTTFSALNFAYADTRPNVVRRVLVHRGDVWLLGEGGFEAFYDAGVTNFPFLRRAGSDIAHGCGAPNAVAIVGNSIFWVSFQGLVFRLNGYNAVRVSTFAIEEWIRFYADFNDIDARYHEFEGHAFFVISFGGTTQRTMAYDCATQRWHDRASGSDATGLWLGRSAAQRGPTTIIGDRTSGQIYTLEPGSDNDNGVIQERVITLPSVYADTDRAFMHRLTLEAQPGTLKTDNNVELGVSDDGGFTYRTRPEGVTTGTFGDTKHRIVWTRLGSFRERILRLRIRGASPCSALTWKWKKAFHERHQF